MYHFYLLEALRKVSEVVTSLQHSKATTFLKKQGGVSTLELHPIRCTKEIGLISSLWEHNRLQLIRNDLAECIPLGCFGKGGPRIIFSAHTSQMAFFFAETDMSTKDSVFFLRKAGNRKELFFNVEHK